MTFTEASKNSGDWLRWGLAYFITVVLGAIGGIVWLTHYQDALSSELFAIHTVQTLENRKLDLILGIPGETRGLLPTVQDSIAAIIKEQVDAKKLLDGHSGDLTLLTKSVEDLTKRSGENQPILKRIDRHFSAEPPQHGE